MTRPPVQTIARFAATLALVVFLGAALGGCSKCGFFWDDWRAKPNACRDAPLR